MHADDAAAALQQFDDALDRFRASGDPHGTVLTLIRIPLACALLGQAERAAAAGEEAIAMCEATGDTIHLAFALVTLAVAVWRAGDSDRASGLVQQALRLNQTMGDLIGTAISLDVLAWIAATAHDFDRAGTLLGMLPPLVGATRVPLWGQGYLPYHDECVRATRAALGERAYDKLVGRGATLSYAEAVEYALTERRRSVDLPGPRRTNR